MAMFLGGEGWLGIDFGRVGATVLYAALWVFVVTWRRYAGQVFPEEWSPAEEQAWVALVFVALVSFNMINLLAALPGLGAAADERAQLGHASARGPTSAF